MKKVVLVLAGAHGGADPTVRLFGRNITSGLIVLGDTSIL